MALAGVALLSALTLRQVPITQDTFAFSDRCLSVTDALPPLFALTLSAQGITFPSMCLTGTANLCTADAIMNVTVGATQIPLELGDGTASNVGPWVELPDLFPGNLCDEAEIRFRNAMFALGGLRACLDLKLSCLPTYIEVPCLEIGDGIEVCTENTDVCQCIQHPECGWCSSGGGSSCMRMQPAPTASDPTAFSTTDPICGCAGSILTSQTDSQAQCSPRGPPPPPPASPPKPPSPPPDYPPFVEPSWVNGIVPGAAAGEALPNFAQWLVWGLCTCLTVLSLAACARAESAHLGRCKLDPAAVGPPSDEDQVAANDRVLGQLPPRVHYGVARIIEQSHPSSRVPTVLWMSQPRMLAHAAVPLALWVASTLAMPVLLTLVRSEVPLQADPEVAPFLLLFLPPLYTLLLFAAIRRTRGTVYALTESGALVMSTTPTVQLFDGRELRRTSYLQMTPAPHVVERRDCRRLTCARVDDVHFASAASTSHPAGDASGMVVAPRHTGATTGPLLFRALDHAQSGRVCALIRQQVARQRQLYTPSTAVAGGAAEEVLEAVSVVPPTRGMVEMSEVRGQVVTDLDLARLSTSEPQAAVRPLQQHGASLTERSDREHSERSMPGRRSFRGAGLGSDRSTATFTESSWQADADAPPKVDA